MGSCEWWLGEELRVIGGGYEWDVVVGDFWCGW